MDNKKKIQEYLTGRQATVKELSEYLTISRQALHRLLKALIESGDVTKVGMPPKVYYMSAQQSDAVKVTPSLLAAINDSAMRVIQDRFLYITAFGEKLAGWNGFSQWCREPKQDVVKMSELYLSTIRKYDHFKVNGLISGKKKLQETFDQVALDELFYLDFYNIEIFGRTKLGQLLLFSKQSQDKRLMNQLIDDIRPRIVAAVEEFNIDGIAFVPATVKRDVQLMKQLQSRLNLNVRTIPLIKVKTQVSVPQKTLSKLSDRITNARETIVVDDTTQYTNILILDDAVGSGATLNEVAKKIKQNGMCSGKIIGLAVTGSANGFDVISEV